MGMFDFKKNKNRSVDSGELIKANPAKLERLPSGGGSMRLPNGNTIILSPEDVNQLLGIANNVITALGEIAKIRESARAQVSLIHAEIDKIHEETDSQLRLNQQNHDNRMETLRQRQEDLQTCLQWLEANPERSASELAYILEAMK